MANFRPAKISIKNNKLTFLQKNGVLLLQKEVPFVNVRLLLFSALITFSELKDHF